MSVTDLHDLQLVWPNPDPTDVIATGTFDQWSSSIHLAKGNAGFSVNVKVPWGEKVAYKFIVDGLWQCRDDRPQEDDGHGNMNNIVQVPAKPVSPTAQEQLARLSIPPELPSEGFGDTEMMVTAVEWTPVGEPAVGVSPPPPAPAVYVEESRPDVPPPAEAPVSEVPFETTVETTSEHQVNGEAHAPNGFTTDVPLQLEKEEPETAPSPAPPAAAEPEPVKEVVVAPSEAGAAEPTQVIEDVAPVPVPAQETSKKELETGDKTAANGHRRQPSEPATTVRNSTDSAPSSTATQKKRRSFLARIRHVFDKNKDNEKDEGKAKDKAKKDKSKV